jgi:hypothetical protein
MEKLIDERNLELWKVLSKSYNIKIIPTNNKTYECHSQNGDIQFLIDKNNYCRDSFTHEMLHVYLRMNGLLIGAGLKRKISGSRILSSIMSLSLLEHIGNCLDHVKMLPIYIKMGFDNEKFLSDFHVNKCTTGEIQQLKKRYRIKNKVSKKAVDLYVGKLVGILGDPNSNFDYSAQLQSLEKIDTLLFEVINRLFEDWSKIKIEDRSVLDDNYNIVLSTYYDGMKEWLSKLNFIN